MDILEIDESLVRSLLSEQHPDLAIQDLRLVDGGWDNQQWRLGDELAVRMPRTPRAPELLRNEQRWLPVLAARLPLPIPTLGLISIGTAGDKGLPGGKPTWRPAGGEEDRGMGNGVRRTDAVAHPRRRAANLPEKSA